MTANTPANTDTIDNDDDRMVSVRLTRDEQAYLTNLIRADLSPAPVAPGIPKDGTDARKLHAEFSAYIAADTHWRTVEAPKIGLADRVESAQPRTRTSKKNKTGADDGAEANK